MDQTGGFDASSWLVRQVARKPVFVSEVVTYNRNAPKSGGGETVGLERHRTLSKK